MKNIKISWGLWGILTLSIFGYVSSLFIIEETEFLSPGKISHGHHQIEMSCGTCHTEPLGGGPVIQSACVNCHAEELKESDDSHPKSKFTDPRNISRVKELDARLCITCHTEHKSEITAKMGVTIPQDFCFKCHEEIAEDRPSHKGMEFSSCGTSGCHNYHDNRSLYEDFLEKHIDEPVHLKIAKNKKLSLPEELTALQSYPVKRYPVKVLNHSEMDAPINLVQDDLTTEDWSATAHAKAGVNCSACHEVKQASGQVKWVEKPSHEGCKTCHQSQVKGFLTGKHGMRLNQGLTAIKPEMALNDMKNTSHGKELSCTSCHSSHKFDVKHAAVEACLNCHNDTHSKKYKDSPHFLTWHKEITGQEKNDTGVSCATCHMPRKSVYSGDKEVVLSEHNQNMNLRPNDKMLRSVCMNCHGLGFSINALADESLIKENFNGLPKVHVQSIDLVKQRLLKRGKPKEGSP